MTIRVFPLPLSDNSLHAHVSLGVRYLEVSSLRRTDEFMILAKWWDAINYPLVLNVSKVTDYLKALNKKTDTFFEFYTIAGKPLGISVSFNDNEAIMSCCCGGLIGVPLTISLEKLQEHCEQVVIMRDYLYQASNKLEYQEVK